MLIQKQLSTMFYKICVLKSFAKLTGKHLRRGLIFKVAGFQLSACNFIEKFTPAQVFFCKFVEFLRTLFFTDYLRATASADLIIKSFQKM